MEIDLGIQVHLICAKISRELRINVAEKMARSTEIIPKEQGVFSACVSNTKRQASKQIMESSYQLLSPALRSL